MPTGRPSWTRIAGSPVAWSGVAPVALLLLLVAAAFGLAAAPQVTAGILLGIALVAAVLLWPLAPIALMMALGAVDLSFVTGGFKSLLPGLGGLDMNGIRLVGLTAGFGAVVLTRKDLLRELASPRHRWYALFLAWGALSLLASPDPLEGLRLLIKLAYPLLVFVLVAAPERTVEEVNGLASWALAGAALVLLLNPLAVLNGAYAVESGDVIRLGGPGTHFNPFSFYLLIVILLSAARFRERGGLHYLALAGMAVVWLAFTRTRITFLAALVALAVSAVYAVVRGRGVRAIGGFVVLGGVLWAGLVTAVLQRTLGYVPTPIQLLSLIRHPTALVQAINWEGREGLWAVLFLVFRRHPFLGSGLGASHDALLRTAQPTTVPHNEYLRLAVDVGLVGVVLYGTAILAWIRTVVAAARARRTADVFASPALAAIAGWAVVALTDNPFDYYGPFTQFVGFLAAAAVVASREPVPAAMRRQRHAPVGATPSFATAATAATVATVATAATAAAVEPEPGPAAGG